MTTPETPSGKNEDTENFPVAQLIRADLRPHVAAYYAFARAADDIGDNPLLDADEKIRRLDRFAYALGDPRSEDVPSAIPLRETLMDTGVSSAHALDLLTAFKQDAVKLRYASFSELMDYCRYSAAPVGRFLLDLHGETQSAWEANDALCAALQILNHVQDCAKDYIELDRVYIPLDLMAKHGADPTHLSPEHEESPPALRATLNELLDLTLPLIAKARELPSQINDKRLKINASIIVVIAEKLAKLLYRRDPLCDNVKLGAFAKAGAALQGFIRAFL